MSMNPGGATGPIGAPGIIGSDHRHSNTRFRSFAERFIIERVRNIPVVDDRVLHGLVLQARTAYKMSREVGYTVDD